MGAPSLVRFRLLALILAVACETPARANLLANGSFETGPAPGVSMQLNPGSTAVTGWTVTRASIDYVGTEWTAAQGVRSIALNGLAARRTSQAFATVPLPQYPVPRFNAGH